MGEAIDEDIATTCFICGRKAREFERNGVSFAYHTEVEHNPWNYLFYMMHLTDKDPTEYTSHESYVSSLLSTNDAGFFPVGEALSLRSEGNATTERLNRIEEHTKYLVELLQREEAAEQVQALQTRQSG